MSALPERNILITGASGQVGFELVRSLQGLGRIVAPDRQALDLGDFDQIREVVRDVRPALIINPGAYTAVDQAEAEPEVAMRVNGVGPGVLAEVAKEVGAVLFHYSTDYVFDGTKADAYLEGDVTGPLNVYGASKLAGELAVEQAGCPWLVFRTSWVYGARGRNFLRTMLRLGEERPELRVVADQIGAPTWSRTIASISAQIAALGLLTHRGDTAWWAEQSGLYNLTASGSTSWAGFAEAIFQLAQPAARTRVSPITSEEYPTPARRPKNSRLSSSKLVSRFGIFPPDWHDALALCIRSL
ncbi:dTDP-4-dehydrorhamnose reductase [Paraburkholderia sp. SOS3]|uniref:dTDP-4-dehydrorhamnose reductase n=1 Tax=Paraburkholderia sp. SOS3 TaxID=1926494 RepID=UPI0009474900|nr:dTDP-4-dehydrorhamnose reductase [Paraburkholderia sp. SOS3]APR37485.1 dTDP-4-dehydrorhamnose reductase [Paraburkholderia sp. SOS3]